MNLMNSLEPQKGSKCFPARSRARTLAPNCTEWRKSCVRTEWTETKQNKEKLIISTASNACGQNKEKLITCITKTSRIFFSIWKRIENFYKVVFALESPTVSQGVRNSCRRSTLIKSSVTIQKKLMRYSEEAYTKNSCLKIACCDNIPNKWDKSADKMRNNWAITQIYLRQITKESMSGRSTYI